MPSDGPHTIHVFWNDSFGTYYHSELRSFQIELLYPPSAPLNLIASAGENSVVLSWSPSSRDGGSVITHYRVYCGTTTGSYTHLKDTLNISFTDTTVIGGTTYYYVVTAINSVGESSFSSEVSITPLEAITITEPTTTETSIIITTTTTSRSAPSIITFPEPLLILFSIYILIEFIRRRKL